jgi:hypothetical protein
LIGAPVRYPMTFRPPRRQAVSLPQDRASARIGLSGEAGEMR